MKQRERHPFPGNFEVLQGTLCLRSPQGSDRHVHHTHGVLFFAVIHGDLRLERRLGQLKEEGRSGKMEAGFYHSINTWERKAGLIARAAHVSAFLRSAVFTIAGNSVGSGSGLSPALLEKYVAG